MVEMLNVFVKIILYYQSCSTWLADGFILIAEQSNGGTCGKVDNNARTICTIIPLDVIESLDIPVQFDRSCPEHIRQ